MKNQHVKSEVVESEKSVSKLMLVFLIPLMLSNAMQSVGQLAGSIIVGRALGVDALAAISAFFLCFFCSCRFRLELVQEVRF